MKTSEWLQIVFVAGVALMFWLKFIEQKNQISFLNGIISDHVRINTEAVSNLETCVGRLREHMEPGILIYEDSSGNSL